MAVDDGLDEALGDAGEAVGGQALGRIGWVMDVLYSQVEYLVLGTVGWVELM